MTIRASASTGTMRARWRRVVFLLTTVAALGLGLSVAAYSGVFGTQEAEAQQNCGSWARPLEANENSLRNFSMRAQYSDNTYEGTVEPSGDHVTIYVRPRINGVTSNANCNPKSVHIRWKVDTVLPWNNSLTCQQMNLDSAFDGSYDPFDGYDTRFPTATEEGCIYWDFWTNWPYQASISLEGRDGTAKRVFDSHDGPLPINVYQAEIRICRTPADDSNHDCSGWSNTLEVDLVNDSAGPSGL